MPIALIAGATGTMANLVREDDGGRIMLCFFCTHLAEFRGTFQGERVPCCLLCTIEYPVRNVSKMEPDK